MNEGVQPVHVQGPAGRLAAFSAGTGGQTVVLVHGLAGTSAWWQSAVRHLGRTHRVITYDLRGHGESAPPADASYALDGQAADLLAVLDALHAERVVLVGHSFGATVVLAALERLGAERVSGVVLVDAAGDFSSAPPGAIEQFIGVLHSEAYDELMADTFSENLARATPETRATVLAGVTGTARAAMQGCYTALLRWRPGAALAAWRGPTLLIGDAGNESAYALHAQHPQRTVRLVNETSHWLHLDQPTAFHAVLDDFLSALRVGDT